MKNDTILIFLDVLGFKSLFEQHGLDYIYNKYDNLIKNTLDAAWARKFVGNYAVVMLAESPVNITYFSDTVILWLNDMNPLTLAATIDSLNELLCKSIEENFPLRGAISRGEAIMDKKNNIFLGKPLISAYMAEGALNLIGVTFSSDMGGKGLSLDPNMVLPYEKHYKLEKMELVKDGVIDYPKHWRNTRKTDIKEHIIKMKDSQIYESPELKSKCDKYYDNTIDFCNYSESVHNELWEKKLKS